MRKKIYNGNPKKWIETGGKGELTPDGDINKSIKKARKKLHKSNMEAMIESIYEKLHESDLKLPNPMENDCPQEKDCNPETCHREDIKRNLYDFQIEKFELEKKYCSPDELKEFITERKQYFISEIQKCLPRINMNQNAKCSHNCFIWLLEFYKTEEDKLNKQRRSFLGHFSWQGTNIQINELSDGLVEAGFIDRDSIKAFTAIFSNDLRNCTPINWRDSIRLLAYLFNQMNSGNKPLILNREWQSVIGKNRLFKKRSGKDITAGDLSSALSAINDPQNGLNPRGHERIDTILNTLRP